MSSSLDTVAALCTQSAVSIEGPVARARLELGHHLCDYQGLSVSISWDMEDSEKSLGFLQMNPNVPPNIY